MKNGGTRGPRLHISVNPLRGPNHDSFGIDGGLLRLGPNVFGLPALSLLGFGLSGCTLGQSHLCKRLGALLGGEQILAVRGLFLDDGLRCLGFRRINDLGNAVADTHAVAVAALSRRECREHPYPIVAILRGLGSWPARRLRLTNFRQIGAFTRSVGTAG